jgi:hypothetical protein
LKLQASIPHVYVQFCTVHLLEAFAFILFDSTSINFYSPPPCLVFTSWSFSTGCVVAHLMGNFISWRGYSEVADFINGVLFLQFQVHSRGVDAPYFWRHLKTVFDIKLSNNQQEEQSMVMIQRYHRTISTSFIMSLFIIYV